MNINSLYNLAKREKINIFNWKMNNYKARIIYDKDYTIYIDYDKLENTIDEKCTLAEELGHYYYNATYSLYSSKSEIERQEYRAKKWQFKTLVPLHKLKELFEKGYKYTYEMAEELEVTEDLVKTAYKYYRENNMIDCY